MHPAMGMSGAELEEVHTHKQDDMVREHGALGHM